MLVTGDGDALEPQITIPPEAQTITIATDGTVSYVQPGQTAAQQAGQIQLANFVNPAGLNSLARVSSVPQMPLENRPSVTREDRKGSARYCKVTRKGRT